MIDVTKEFIISPGGLHLEASLDKEVWTFKIWAEIMSELTGIGQRKPMGCQN